MICDSRHSLVSTSEAHDIQKYAVTIYALARVHTPRICGASETRDL